MEEATLRKIPLYVAASLLGLAAAGAARAQPAPAGIASSESVSATVETVDMIKREVLLRRQDGNLATIVAGPEVRNLAQVRPGDVVTVTLKQALAVAVTPPGDSRPPVAGGLALGRAAAGERPGAAAGKVLRVRVRIDAAAASGDRVTFTGPRGNQVSVPVADPGLQNFVRGLKPGDTVDIAYVEAEAVQVVPARR